MLHHLINPTRYDHGSGIMCIRHDMRRRPGNPGRRFSLRYYDTADTAGGRALRALQLRGKIGCKSEPAWDNVL